MDGDDTFLYQGGTVKDRRITNVVVKAGIRKIDDYAFECCYDLVHVSIPDSVTSIGRHAFCYSGLETIAIPEGVKKIEEGTFMNCEDLERIELPNSITSIGEGAFRCCESLWSIAIPKGVDEIGAEAFMMSEIEEIIVPNGIKVIPYRAFYCCLLLQKVELPSSVEEIGEDAFDHCDNLQNFVIPNGLPNLTKLNLNAYSFFGVHGFDLISQLVFNSPNLEELSLKFVGIERSKESGLVLLSDDDIPMLLQLVSLCPSLRTLNVSENYFTPNVFGRLASQNVPGHLRRLKICSRASWRNSEVETHDLLRVLEANPKLGIWTDQF